MANLKTNTYLPKWYHSDAASSVPSPFDNCVVVQVTDDRGSVAGHATRTYDECWPHLQSRDGWMNSPIYKEMEEEAIQDRKRRISELA